jgi:hypothetical protein
MLKQAESNTKEGNQAILQTLSWTICVALDMTCTTNSLAAD